MENVKELITWLTSNYIAIIGVLTTLSVLFVSVAKLTKTKKDDEWAGYFVEGLSALKRLLTPKK